MSAVDLAGWMAAALTLTTFVCRDIRRLRLLALAANVAFIVYGANSGLLPVLALHAVLVPVNLWRLRELARAPGANAAPAPAGLRHRRCGSTARRLEPRPGTSLRPVRWRPAHAAHHPLSRRRSASDAS